jgi:hypothetical protein
MSAQKPFYKSMTGDAIFMAGPFVTIYTDNICKEP